MTGRGVKMGTHKELEVWRQAIELAKSVYRLTADFPAPELYGLVSQMRRSAVSVASNIAEACRPRNGGAV